MNADNRHYSEINAAFEQVIKLDPWDIGAILGGVNYFLRSSAINATIRLLPDPPPEGSGIDYFTNWEANTRRPEIEEKTAPFLGLAQKVTELMDNYCTLKPQDNEEVKDFMTSPSRIPKQSIAVAEYKRRMEQGMKPNMPMRKFVELEYAVALKRHALLMAKAEDAVKALNRVEPSDGDLPEWAHEAIHNKILQKLKDRWEHSEIRRTNERLSKEMRDLAEANQRLIEAAMIELGGEVPKDEEAIEAEAAKGIDDWLKFHEGVDKKA